jgi:hypothetical protein
VIWKRLEWLTTLAFFYGVGGSKSLGVIGDGSGFFKTIKKAGVKNFTPAPFKPLVCSGVSLTKV